MKCPTCGADNEAGNRFCEQCGSRLDVAPGSPSAPASNQARRVRESLCREMLLGTGLRINLTSCDRL